MKSGPDKSLARPMCGRQIVNLSAGLNLFIYGLQHVWTPLEYICDNAGRSTKEGAGTVASLLSGKVRNTERGAVAGELGRQLCSDRGGVQKGRAGEVG